VEHKERMGQYIRETEEALERYLPQRENYQKRLYEAMRYSLMAPGKRLRPVMTMAFCEMCGGDRRNALPFACGLEMIHNYSLIHDDLPCMDDDDLRRGRPTNHKVYGEALAVLAGDGLLHKAFETVCDHLGETSLEPAVAWRAMQVLAHESGSEGMLGGQVVDVENEGKKLPLEELTYLENLKTSGLFRAAAKMGCIVGGGTPEQLEAAEKFATALGLAFQIQDDILDVEGDEAELGKPVGSDADNEKYTFTTLLGLEGARQEVRRLTEEAQKALQAFPDAAFMNWLAELLVDRKK
jgi:geranylgeranyl diphosphate synthase type II